MCSLAGYCTTSVTQPASGPAMRLILQLRLWRWWPSARTLHPHPPATCYPEPGNAADPPPAVRQAGGNPRNPHVPHRGVQAEVMVVIRQVGLAGVVVSVIRRVVGVPGGSGVLVPLRSTSSPPTR